MKINSISPISTKSKINAKALKNTRQMTIPLKNGNYANLTVADNYIETIVTKGDKVVQTSVQELEQDAPSRFLWKTYENLQKQVKEGFDFFSEFSKAILR